MKEIDLSKYAEEKPHYVKMVVWRIYNTVIFPLLPCELRIVSLRFFGAKVGAACFFNRFAKFYAPWNFCCGDAVCIGPRVRVYNKGLVRIGNNVVVSQDAWLCTATHDLTSCRMKLVTSPIAIADNVWIAAKASLLPGVSIGVGAVVGACAVVAKNVESWAVVAGNPANIIGKRSLDNE